MLSGCEGMQTDIVIDAPDGIFDVQWFAHIEDEGLQRRLRRGVSLVCQQMRVDPCIVVMPRRSGGIGPEQRCIIRARNVCIYLVVVVDGYSMARAAAAFGGCRSMGMKSVHAIEDLRDFEVFDCWMTRLEQQYLEVSR